MSAIQTKNLSVHYSDFTLGPIQIDIPKGMITGLIGRNGAGKSTMIQSILGLRAYQGEIRIDGKKISDFDKNKISFVLDTCTFPQNLTPSQIAASLSGIYSTWDQTVYHRMMETLELPQDKALRTYSKGMKAMFALAIALSHHAQILILDEATVGLDPVIRDEILDLLLEFIQDPEHTVILSTHISSDLEKIADYIALFENGQIEIFQDKDSLLEEYVVAHLSPEAFQDLDPNQVVRYIKKPCQIDVLMKKDRLPEKIIYDPIVLDDLLSMFSKGEER